MPQRANNATRGYASRMSSGKSQSSGAYAAAVSSEIRAAMARNRISGVELAKKAGVSQNYISKRLRDEMPFTLNDVEVIANILGLTFEELATAAAEHLKDK